MYSSEKPSHGGFDVTVSGPTTDQTDRTEAPLVDQSAVPPPPAPRRDNDERRGLLGRLRDLFRH
jgi:hypothetical protein